MGASLLVVAVLLFGIGINTVVGIAKDPSHIKNLKSQLTVGSTGPDASFAWASQGHNVSFTDTSRDNSSTITTWLWDFGDGNTYSGATPPPHTYATNCPRCDVQVTLVVGDAAGHNSTASASVQLQNVGDANGVGQSPISQIQEPQAAVALTEGLTAIELLVVMFFIGASVARAGWRLLHPEDDSVPVPVRERTAAG